tara:strand:- start:739 stop:1044 length:306 start_codon:yes stop_codon:yes gene_type:complete
MPTENAKSISRYSHGVRALNHKGHNCTTSVGSQMDLVVEDIANVDSRVGRIPPQFAHRPDLISNLFYGTPGYWWYLMQVNGISDPMEGFNSGDQILIPSLA